MQLRILGLILSLSPTTCWSVQSWRLVPFNTTYVIHSTGLDVGRLEQSVRPLDQNRYAFRTNTFAIGMAALMFKERTREESIFKVTDNRIVALQYQYERSGGSNAKSQRIVFDRAARKIKGQTNGDVWEMAWQPLPFDNLLYQIAMLRDAASGKSTMDYTIIDNGSAKTYHFIKKGSESIKTPAGEFETIKLERIQMQDKRATTIWSAPKLNYLPVRLDNVDRHGRAATVLLEKFDQTVSRQDAAD